MYGSRQKLWDMTWLYQEISDFSRIFNVEDRGQALIADFKKREADLRRSLVKAKGISPSSSGSPAPHLRPMPMSAAKTAPPDLSPACWADIMRLPPKPSGPR